jgi:hypothetical protein
VIRRITPESDIPVKLNYLFFHSLFLMDREIKVNNECGEVQNIRWLKPI